MNTSLEKETNENVNQYLWRVGKLIDDGYYKNWTEVLDDVNLALFGNDTNKYKGESAYRKTYAAARLFYNDVFLAEFSKGDNALDKKLNEIKDERYKLSAEKIELNRTHRQRARFDLFYENVAKEFEKYPKLPCEIKEILPTENPREYILTVADIHYGANFVTETNIYNNQECKRRFEKLLAETRQFIWNNCLTHLNVLNLGDEIQGILRMTDLSINETTAVQAIVGIARILSEFLYKLSTECTIDYYSVPRSNHTQTRPLGSKASELAAEDVIYIIDHYIKDMLAENPNINIHTTDGRDYIELPIFDYKVIGHHGHNIKNIENYINEISSYKREFIDFVFLGHYHSKKTTTSNAGLTYDTEIIVCPSFVGSDPYAESLLKSNKAACMIYGFDKRDGLKETYKIILN